MNRKYITTLIVIAFFLHIIWENVQAPLYAGYQSFSQHLQACLIGALGDVIITFSVLMFFALLKKEKIQMISDFMALAVIGFFVSVAVEQHALLTGKWNYATAMPIIPWLHVGLTPVMQMTVLLPLSFYLTELFNRK